MSYSRKELETRSATIVMSCILAITAMLCMSVDPAHGKARLDSFAVREQGASQVPGAPILGTSMIVGPLSYSSHLIDDDNSGNSTGNSDGQADAGEVIELYLDLYNDGTEMATGVQVNILSDSPYLTATFNTSSAYPDIAAGGIATNSNDYDYQVDQSTPDGHAVTFTLSITASNGGPWTDQFTILITNSQIPVALISDQDELARLGAILGGAGFGPTLLNHNWNGAQPVYTDNPTTLGIYEVVIWYASGDGFGRTISQAEHDVLEGYLQTGGRLLVTGYDTLGHPDDPLLADLVRSSSFGDGPFTTTYNVADGSHPIMSGPHGSFATGLGITAVNEDHDQAEADVARGAVTVAELVGGSDKIIATDLDPAPASGRVVYWNGNHNLTDWIGGQPAIAGKNVALRSEDKPERGRLDPFDGRRLQDLAVSLSGADLPAAANAAPDARGLRLPDAILAELSASAAAVSLSDQTFTFPTAAAGYNVQDDPYWWHAGDHVQETFVLDPPMIERIEYSIVIQQNSLSGAGHVDLNLSINGILVGSYTVQPGDVSLLATAEFPPITGPTYTFRLEETNTIGVGEGSIVLPPGLSTMTVVNRQTEIFLNTMAWLADGATLSDPNEPNDTPATCTALGYHVPLDTGVIDPPGDVDYFCFSGTAGAAIVGDIDAGMIGSDLDAVLTLFDTDGVTVLAEDDDTHGVDPWLQHTLPADGDYYFRVRSYGDPCCGGPSFTYTLTLGTPAGPVILAGTPPVIEDGGTGGSFGNQNHEPDAAEVIELYVSFENAGNTPLTGVEGFITEQSPHVQGFINNAFSAYPDLPAGGSAVNLDGFEFLIDWDTPTGHVIDFTMQMGAHGGSGPWSEQFQLTVVRSAPEITVTTGDLEFHLAEGETDTGTITITNDGFDGLLTWSLTEQCPWMSASATGGSLMPGAQVELTVTVDATGLAAGAYNCDLDIASSDVDEPTTVITVVLFVDSPQCPPACVAPAVRPGNSIGTDGATFFVEVDVEQTAAPIGAFSFELRYDPAVLDFLDNAEAGDLTQGFVTVDASENMGGIITCGGFGSPAIPSGSSGAIIRLEFQVNCSTCAEGDVIDLIATNLLDDLAAMTGCCGTFTYTECPSDGDVNEDGTLTAGDALCAFRIFLAGQVVTQDCDVAGDCEVQSADVDCSTQVTAGDALAIFQAFLASDPPSPCFAQRGASARAAEPAAHGVGLGAPAGRADGQLIVPVEASAGSPPAFGAEVRYDAEALTFVGVERGEVTIDWEAVDAVETTPGLVRLGGFGAAHDGRAGELARLVFRVADEAAAEGSTIAITEVIDSRLDGTGEVEVVWSALAPVVRGIERIFPRPALDAATISFGVTGDSAMPVWLGVYEVSGRLVRTLLHEPVEPGRHRFSWDGRGDRGTRVGSGVYFVRLRMGGEVWTEKLLLLH